MEKKIALVITGLLVLLMLVGFVSARYMASPDKNNIQKPYKNIKNPDEEAKSFTTTIYQENAEGSIVKGIWYYGGNKTRDGDWNSYDFESMAKDSYLELIYVKPQSAISAVWKVKDGDRSANLTIPDSCFDSDSEELLLRAQSGGEHGEMLVRWECYNNGSWMELRFTRYTRSIYEEGIYWEISV